jgi:hypothetical protein
LIAVVGGLAAASLDVGIAGYLVVSLVGAFLWAPFIPCLLVVAYRDRIAHETPVVPVGQADPDIPAGAVGSEV